MTRSILFTTVRGEAPYLLEWIAYYRVLGFDEIVIYSNDPMDKTDVLLSELHKHGFIHHVLSNPKGHSPQYSARKSFEESGFAKVGDYVCWLDLDEFLTFTNENYNLKKLLGILENSNDAIVLNWRYFGDSGNTTFNGRIISSEFTRCAKNLVPTIKTISKVTDFFELRVHAPVVKTSVSTPKLNIINGSGRRIDLTKAHYSSYLEGKPIWDIDNADIGGEIAQINHYFTKTKSCFYLKKIRGSAAFSTELNLDNYRATDENFNSLNLNNTTDNHILKYEKATTDEINTLLSVGNVSKIQSEIWEAF